MPLINAQEITKTNASNKKTKNNYKYAYIEIIMSKMKNIKIFFHFVLYFLRALCSKL